MAKTTGGIGMGASPGAAVGGMVHGSTTAAPAPPVPPLYTPTPWEIHQQSDRMSRPAQLVRIEKAENGFVLYYSQNYGALQKMYLCANAKEIAERVVACMVESKLAESE